MSLASITVDASASASAATRAADIQRTPCRVALRRSARDTAPYSCPGLSNGLGPSATGRAVRREILFELSHEPRVRSP